MVVIAKFEFNVALYSHGDRTDYQGQGAQGGHLYLHTALELSSELTNTINTFSFHGFCLWLSVALRPQKPQAYQGLGFYLKVSKHGA